MGLAAYVLNEPGPAAVPTGTDDVAQYFDQSANLEERIRALEAAVADERDAFGHKVLSDRQLQRITEPFASQCDLAKKVPEPGPQHIQICLVIHSLNGRRAFGFLRPDNGRMVPDNR